MPFVEVSLSSGSPYEIYYRTFPEASTEDLRNRPRVILLMGLGGTHSLWKPQIAHLQNFCHVCAMDNRGAGYSGKPKGQRWTTERMAKDAVAVLDHLGWQDHIHIIGISMGGMIAQELAIAVPKRVASVALLATYASVLWAAPTTSALVDFARSTGWLTRDLKEMGKASMRLNFPDAWLGQTRASELHDGKIVENQRWMNKAFILMSLDVPPELKAQGKGPPGRVHPKSMLKQALAVLTHHVSKARCQQLRDLGVPVLVLTGSDDCLVRPYNSVIIADHFETKVHTLKNAGHGLIFQEADAVNSLLERNIQAGETYARHPQSKL
ncbi:rutD [Symbiodinium pilosum]|uniref:RutD protein n=1 Tax=Symbiodinium pilosum TaxID=2952 RepID=A0A812PB68_SYMPI|nr:rutD [Symbiodinium pilosum]